MKIHASNYMPMAYAYGISSSGRISIPVPPSQLVYSYFKNVAGVPTQNASSYSLDKLKILDSLIEQMRNIKQHSIEHTETSGITDEQAQILIDKYGKTLHDNLTQENQYKKLSGIVPGFLVSVAA